MEKYYYSGKRFFDRFTACCLIERIILSRVFRVINDGLKTCFTPLFVLNGKGVYIIYISRFFKSNIV